MGSTWAAPFSEAFFGRPARSNIGSPALTGREQSAPCSVMRTSSFLLASRHDTHASRGWLQLRYEELSKSYLNLLTALRRAARI